MKALATIALLGAAYAHEDDEFFAKGNWHHPIKNFTRNATHIKKNNTLPIRPTIVRPHPIKPTPIKPFNKTAVHPIHKNVTRPIGKPFKPIHGVPKIPKNATLKKTVAADEDEFFVDDDELFFDDEELFAEDDELFVDDDEFFADDDEFLAIRRNATHLHKNGTHPIRTPIKPTNYIKYGYFKNGTRIPRTRPFVPVPIKNHTIRHPVNKNHTIRHPIKNHTIGHPVHKNHTVLRKVVAADEDEFFFDDEELFFDDEELFAEDDELFFDDNELFADDDEFLALPRRNATHPIHKNGTHPIRPRPFPRPTTRPAFNRTHPHKNGTHPIRPIRPVIRPIGRPVPRPNHNRTHPHKNATHPIRPIRPIRPIGHPVKKNHTTGHPVKVQIPKHPKNVTHHLRKPVAADEDEFFVEDFELFAEFEDSSLFQLNELLSEN